MTREFGLSGLLTGVVLPLSSIVYDVYVYIIYYNHSLCQDILILSLVINWRLKRALNLNPKN